MLLVFSQIYTYISLCYCPLMFFFFKQKTAYDMRISDWSSDVCSSDLIAGSVSLKLRHIRAERMLSHPQVRRSHRIRHKKSPGEIGRASCRERVCQYV